MNLVNNFKSFEEVKHYFREQVKKLHPDKGGNKEDFLNLLEWYQNYLKNYKNISQIKIVKNPPLKGNYFFSILDLSVEEVALGGKKKIQIFGEEKICPKCYGTGKDQNGKVQLCPFCKGKGIIDDLICPYCKGEGHLYIENCKECKGKGKIKTLKEIVIDIPLGLKNRDILFIPKEAVNTDYDLYLEINILSHPYFVLDGPNLIYKCNIPFWEVILKKEISIKTLEGEEYIPSELFTQGTPIVLKERGPFLENNKRGDLIIDFNLYVPKDIPLEAMKLISKAVKIIEKYQKI